MNITKKVTLGLVFIAFFSVALVTFSVPVQAQQTMSQQERELEALLAALQAELREVESGLAAAPAAGSAPAPRVSNAACPYTWARNLTVGSTGDDVRQLQRFLNGNPQTMVATSGVGSPGNESRYYGPATSGAVRKYQNLHAAEILAPLQLTHGTGRFYTSTRNHVNNSCRVAVAPPAPAPAPLPPEVVVPTPTPAPTPPPVREVRVVGDTLSVVAGKQPGDAFAVRGAQRVPFTSFVLTAGSDDVRVEGVRIKRFGLSSSDNFDSVALVDLNGAQIGSSRSLNSRDEAVLGGNFVIPSGRSITLVIVGNITDDENEIRSGAVAGLEVVEVSTSVSVDGRFPIRGAAHVISDSIVLDTVAIDVDPGDSEIEFDMDTEVASVEIELRGGNSDREDAYLRSITLEQDGSADEREIGDVTLYADGDEVDYDLTVDGRRYIFMFDGDGLLIEENEDIELTIEVNTNTGTDETVRFTLDDESDVYIVGKTYGYGLPIMSLTDEKANRVEDASGNLVGAATIQAGTIRSRRARSFEDEVVYGKDVVLGVLEAEFEGEDIIIEGLTFTVELEGYPYVSSSDNGWVTIDEDELRLTALTLRVDDENVAYDDDDIEFLKTDAVTRSGSTISKTIEMNDEFTVAVQGERNVVFEVIGDMDEHWSSFDGADITFTLTDVDTAEGYDSEKDYTRNGEYFSRSQEFEPVEIRGNLIEVEVNDHGVADDEFVAGAEDVPFGTIKIDTEDSVNDVEVTDIYVSFVPTGGGDLEVIDDCKLYDGEEEEADTRSRLRGTSTDQVHFDLGSSGYEIEAGESVEFLVKCDIDEDAVVNSRYQLAANTASDVNDRVEYEIGADDFEASFVAGDVSDVISVSANGLLRVSLFNPDEDETTFAQATGRNGVEDIALLEMRLEADREDIKIEDVYLANVSLPAGSTAVNRVNLERLLERVQFTIDGSTKYARPRDYKNRETFTIGGSSVALDNLLAIEGVNETIEIEDGRVAIDLVVDFDGINEFRGQAGQYLQAQDLVIRWIGEDSNEREVTRYTIPDGIFSEAVVFPTVPTVASSSRTSNLSNGDQKLYEFTVRAGDEGDIFLDTATLQFTTGGSVDVDNVEIRRGQRVVAGGSTFDNMQTVGQQAFVFTNPEDIPAGTTVTYSVYGSITTTTTNDSVVVRLLPDTTASNQVGRAVTAARSGSSFVWSPQTDDDYDRTDARNAANTDWFNGWSVFESTDVDSWTSER